MAYWAMERGGGDYQLLSYVIKSGVLPYADALKLWADSIDVAWVDLRETLFQPYVVDRVSADFAKENRLMPIYKMGELVTVAMVDPKDGVAIAKLEKVLGTGISPVFAPIDEIEYAIEIQSQSHGKLESINNKFSSLMLVSSDKIKKGDLEGIAGEDAIIEFTRALLLLAEKEEASDIHIEPGEDHVTIRYRIDGTLHERLKLSSDMLSAITSRIKIMSGLDITEKRRPPYH